MFNKDFAQKQEDKKEEQAEKKRKRDKEARRSQEEETVRDIFKKSKKIERSPPKKTQEKEEMEKILEKLSEIQEEIKEIRRENKEVRKEMEKMQAETKEKEKKWEEEKKQIEERMTRLEKEKEKERRQERRNRIIIKGWQGKGNKEEITKELESFILQSLKETVEVTRATTLKNRATVVEIRNWEDKMKIMRNRKKLNEREETKKIHIDNDLTETEREIQTKIWKEVEEEKRAGKRVWVGYRKAKIGEEEWVWNEERGKLEKKTFR